MTARTLLPRLEAWAQEELGVQQRLAEALAVHERELGCGDADAIAASLAAIDAVDNRGAARRRELDTVLRELAGAWGLATGTLTLGSVAERFGPDGQRLARLRATLRETCRDVQDRSRRVALIAKQQREVVRLALESVVGREGFDGQRGSLVDSRV